MNGNTITRALATAGFTAAAGLATMLGTTAAHAAPPQTASRSPTCVPA